MRSVGTHLKKIFPTLEWAYGGTYYDDGFHSTWLDSKRACTARYFSRYFELQTSVGEISESRFVAFIEATATDGRLAAAIASTETEGLLASLAARLDESVSRLPVENAGVLLPGMFQIAQKFSGSSNFGFGGSPWISAWRAAHWYLMRIPEEVRGEHALEALRETEALSVTAMMIHLNDPADRNANDTAPFDPALNLRTVEALKLEWLRLIRLRAHEDGLLIADPDLLSLLYRWRDYAGSLEEPRTWMAEAIRTDEGFAKVVTSLMSSVTSHVDGDRVSTSHLQFNKQTIDDFIGIDAAKVRCETIDPLAFPLHQSALQKLKISIERWLDLSGPDPFDL